MEMSATAANLRKIQYETWLALELSRFIESQPDHTLSRDLIQSEPVSDEGAD